MTSPITYSGKLRIYFNRHGAAPRVWCVAAEQWELAVTSVVIASTVTTVYQPKATNDEDDGLPSAWLETVGRLTVDASGLACIAQVVE